jgi:GH24 family phage-related lysozyme (muramidase)
MLNASKYEQIPLEINRWNKSKGKTLLGLTKRRQAEAKLFMTPILSVKCKL